MEHKIELVFDPATNHYIILRDGTIAGAATSQHTARIIARGLQHLYEESLNELKG